MNNGLLYVIIFIICLCFIGSVHDIVVRYIEAKCECVCDKELK